MKKASHDRCEFCDGIVGARTIQARFHFKGKTIYVDRVPPGYVSSAESSISMRLSTNGSRRLLSTVLESRKQSAFPSPDMMQVSPNPQGIDNWPIINNQSIFSPDILVPDILHTDMVIA